MIKYETQWDEESGLATAQVIDTTLGEVFVGTAFCSEEDQDMKSRLTGQEIALRRAFIEHIKYLKRLYSVKYNTLKNFKKQIEGCKHYNSEFQIEMILERELKELGEQVAHLRCKLEVEKSHLREYIRAKAEIYQKIREGRKAKN